MIEQSYDIYKVSGIIIRERQVLATRSKGKSFYIQPGGKPEGNETDAQAVIRELREEMGIEVSEDNLEVIGTYYAEAAGQNGKRLKLVAYLVKNFTGIPQPQSEVEEIRGFTSQLPDGVELASILKHDIIPELKARDMID